MEKHYYSSLSDEEQKIIFNMLKICFSDCPYFDTMIADKLIQLLADSNYAEINVASTKRVTDKYFDTKSFKDTPQRKLIFTQIQLIFKCCYVLILTFHPNLQALKWGTVEELLAAYPAFQTIDDNLELQYLLNFRNTLRIALEIVPAPAHKQLLINIAGRLEGSNCSEYITGGGQKPCVNRRVAIYEQEGSVQPSKKSAKKPREEQQGRKYAGHEYVSIKKVKAVKLTEDEIEQLKRPRTDNNNKTSKYPAIPMQQTDEDNDEDDSDNENPPPTIGMHEELQSSMPPVHINAEQSSLCINSMLVAASADFNPMQHDHSSSNNHTSFLPLPKGEIGDFKSLPTSIFDGNPPKPVVRLTTFGKVNVQEVNKECFGPQFFDSTDTHQDEVAAHTLLHIARETYTDEMLKILDGTAL
eukprot:CAMPEP_0170074002 /NCGR_PEP_ID=MMETSP0019_2-20121128/11363_1 /TAXON_ID=98059 /ORGANISM="Dinobryon sp., Strain UTEXLB2267" /LENGTH=412 /DNA_ID=CAMNT_0010283983 /DNA_START=161 /DNA_END=1399 /DNA_ORIENTATION=-